VSGFVALLHADGRPVDDRLGERLNTAMSYRGPDRLSRWSGGGVSLGHAAFHTLETPGEAPQPAQVDDHIHIVADARVDDRADLTARLAAAGRPGLDDAPDSLLLAHAYATWGEAMLDGLLGDFAFVVWDARARRLFGARDHMGVKPFYYAVLGGDLLVGNTLPALRAHPGVSDELDERAITDYLLFGLNRHPTRTSFAAIRRLPPAHLLSWRPGSTPQTRRYWRLTPQEPASRREDDILAAFADTLRRATADRVRGRRAAVLMSGGLDSTAVAALVHETQQQRYEQAELTACILVYERLIDDPEPAYARLVAEKLGIPLREIPLDDDVAADLWGPSASWSAEPNELPASARMVRLISAAAPATRVGFTGQGGDPALHITPADAAHRAAGDGWLRTAAAMLRHRARHGMLPRVGLRTYLRRRLRDRRCVHPAPFPPWLRRDVVDRLDLRRRHAELIDRRPDRSAPRPDADFQLNGPEWSFFLEWYDPGMTGFPAEYRHPLLDVRVLQMALGLPAIPWLAEKHVLRHAMRGRLPESVLTRRKAPLAGDPLHAALRAGPVAETGPAWGDGALGQFLDVERLRSIVRHPERLRPSESELVTRPLGLALWLSRLQAGGPHGMEVTGGADPDHVRG